MDQRSALARVTEIAQRSDVKTYPYAKVVDGQHRLGYRVLPAAGAGPPEDIVLGFGPSWEDALRMAEGV